MTSGSGDAPIVLLDDSASEDDDSSVVIVIQHHGQQRRRREGATRSSNAAVVASSSSVVDLTSATTSASASRSHNNARNNDGDVIQVVASTASRSTGGHASVAAAAAQSIRNQLAQYQSSAADSLLQIVGMKRSRPPPAPAAARGPVDRVDASRFNFGGNNFGGGRNSRVGVEQPLPVPHLRHSPPQQPKKKRSKKDSTPPPPPPMEKGKSMMKPIGFDAVDMYYPHLKASDRTTVLYQLLPKGYYTKKFTHDWRVRYEKDHPKPTLLAMALALSDEIVDDVKKMTAMPKGGDKEQRDKENEMPLLWDNKGDDKDDDEDRKPTSSIGPLNGEIIDTLRTYFRAHVGRHFHKTKLDSIEPIASDSSGVGALTCSICSDDFDPSNTVPCSGEKELHFFCKRCFTSYATVTVESGPIQSISCPVPSCGSLFATADAKENLSEWDLLMIEHRETSRDRRVALAAKAVLHCECGQVAIITEDDVGNGRVTCPGNNCGKRYCCKCGNDDHGTEPCPPPAETVQWLDEHSKECPNCKNRIQKNGGCDHMTCRPPGGCGFEFWWTCVSICINETSICVVTLLTYVLSFIFLYQGCPFKGKHKPGCKRLGEQRR